MSQWFKKKTHPLTFSLLLGAVLLIAWWAVDRTMVGRLVLAGVLCVEAFLFAALPRQYEPSLVRTIRLIGWVAILASFVVGIWVAYAHTDWRDPFEWVLPFIFPLAGFVVAYFAFFAVSSSMRKTA